MGTYRVVVVGLAILGVFLCAKSGYARQNRSEEDVLQHFQRAVEAYAVLHREAQRTVPPLEISPDAEKIHRAVEALADAIRTARPSARTGDVFDAAASAWLRTRIRETLRERGDDAAAILAAARDEDETATPLRPEVNGSFPWAQGSVMPPYLLAVLPELPIELEYRFLARDLVLIDIQAALVVDVLPDALPAGGSR